jgi:hypothetical protein
MAERIVKARAFESRMQMRMGDGAAKGLVETVAKNLA